MNWIALSLAAPAVGLLAAGALTFAGRRASRSARPGATRTGAALQLLRWFTLVVSTMIGAGVALAHAGIPSSVLLIFAGSMSTGVAFALREPISDFFAAATLLVERVARLGDEVKVNEDVAGRLVSFGLRGITLETWTGDHVYVVASTIRTFRNVSLGASRATVDIDIPAVVRLARATQVVETACRTATNNTFHSAPTVLGVVSQKLDVYVLRVSCIVDPATHREAEYRLKAAAVDAVNELRVAVDDDRDTKELVGLAALMAEGAR